MVPTLHGFAVPVAVAGPEAGVVVVILGDRNRAPGAYDALCERLHLAALRTVVIGFDARLTRASVPSLLDGLGIRWAVLVGDGAGGDLAWELAATAAGRFVGLVVIDRGHPRVANPQGMVPALQNGDMVLTQSPAILEWLEETHPDPALLPKGANDRATVRAMAALIGCDIHPLNNLRVLKAIRSEFNADQAAVDAWAARWIAPGFDALEALVARHGAGWSFGDAPTLVDCYLIPQMYSARRFNMDLSPWPRLLAVEQTALAHPAFASAHPDVQPDADA